MRPSALVIAAAASLAITACGGGKSDKDKITDLVKDVGKNPATLCDQYATQVLIDQVGGHEACAKLTRDPKSKDPDVKVDSIAIVGKTATANVTGNRGHQRIGLVREGDGWRVSSVASG